MEFTLQVSLAAKSQSSKTIDFSREIHLPPTLAPNCLQSDSTMKTLILLIPAALMATLTSCTTVVKEPAATTTTTTHETTAVTRPATATQTTTVHSSGGY
jgi:hypothetical protein